LDPRGVAIALSEHERDSSGGVVKAALLRTPLLGLSAVLAERDRTAEELDPVPAGTAPEAWADQKLAALGRDAPAVEGCSDQPEVVAVCLALTF